MLTCRQEMKVLSIIVKYLPVLIALMYFINSMLSLLDIYISIISYLIIKHIYNKEAIF